MEIVPQIGARTIDGLSYLRLARGAWSARGLLHPGSSVSRQTVTSRASQVASHGGRCALTPNPFADYVLHWTVLALEAAYELWQFGAMDTKRSTPWKLAISAVRFLVTPKFLAMLVMLPCLTIWANAMGVFGGSLFGVAQVDFTSGRYIRASI
jgi:hypothetical protein